MKKIEFKPQFDLTKHLNGRAIIAFGICYDDTLAVLVTDPAVKARMLARPEDIVPQLGRNPPFVYAVTPEKTLGAPEFDYSEPEEWTTWRKFVDESIEVTYSVSLLLVGASGIDEIELQPLDGLYPTVQVLPDETILVVSATVKGGDSASNAILFSRDGNLIRRFSIGAFNDVQVSATGQIWVSYGDQAVLSHGRPGLCRFNTSGIATWSFTPNDCLDDNFGRIYDCDAMNVSAEQVWATYCEDFPVIRVNEAGKIDAWRNEFHGAKAIAVDRERVLLYGGYQHEKTRCVVQTTGTGGAMINPIAYNLLLPGEIEALLPIRARGPNLYALVGFVSYRVELDDLT